MIKHLGIAAFLTASASGVVLLAPSVQAQVSVMMTRSIGDGPGSGMVSKRSMEKYFNTLGLNEEQRDSALTLYDGYSAAYKQARDEQRRAVEDVRRTAEDTGDHSAFMEKMPGIEKAFKDKSESLEKGLFSDLRAVITPEQEKAWPSVERARRREVGLRGASLSGEGIDLIEVVDGLKLTDETSKPVVGLLSEYEVDLDRALQERAASAHKDVDFEPGKPMDIEKLQAAMKAQAEAGEKIVSLNERHARKIEGVLPEDKRAEFKEAMRRATFPRVYKPSRAIKQVDAALGLSDLDASQREQLTQLRDSYARDARPLNDAWAAAIAESEKSGDNGAIGGAGNRMVLRMGDEPKALVDARKARRELDDKVSDRLRSILKAEQAERLPKAADDSDGEVMGGGRFIMREESR